MALNRATDAYSEALNLYREAQNPLPNLNAQDLSQEAMQIKEEVGIILALVLVIVPIRTSLDDSLLLS